MNSFQKASEWCRLEIAPQELLETQCTIRPYSHACMPAMTENFRILQWENVIRVFHKQTSKYKNNGHSMDFILTDEDKEQMNLFRMQKKLEQQ